MQHRQHLGHIRALDGLRGFALLLVFGYHALSRELVSTSLAGTLAKKIALTGWVGVDLFFVLSGFLITSILLDARTAGNYLRVFYARRALRIFPLYYLVLAASLLLMPDHFGWKAQIFYWFNLSNLVTAFHPLLIPYLAHFWSLAIEEQFYLVWPALVLLLRPRALAALCGGVLVAVFAARNLPAILALNQRFPDFVYRFTPPARGHALRRRASGDRGAPAPRSSFAPASPFSLPLLRGALSMGRLRAPLCHPGGRACRIYVP